jgi:hypothetical protein
MGSLTPLESRLKMRESATLAIRDPLPGTNGNPNLGGSSYLVPLGEFRVAWEAAGNRAVTLNP